jgi:hypothetical protein
MNWKRVLAGVAVLGFVACGGGGDDSGTNPTNRAPEIAFTFKPLATAKNVPVDLTITATDQDGDPLTINWTVTRGTLAAQNSKKTIMRWTVPATVGVDTVNVSVSDGTVTRKLTEAIHVATVDNDGPFTKSNSPYIIATAGPTPRLAVPAGSTLTIQAGTQIYINAPGLVLDVTGTLSAHGTAGEPIAIYHNDRSFVCGGSNDGWQGIQASREAGASEAGVVDLEYVDLWYPVDGIRLQDDAVATLNNCSVRCSKHAGVWMEGSGVVKVIDSKLTDGAGDGLAIAAVASVPDSVLVQGSTLSFNNGSGIRMDLNDTSKSAFIDVQYNDFQFNSTHGISLAHSVFPQIHFNNFRGNGDSSVSSLYLQSGYPGVAQAELDATCNFWGSASAQQSTIDIGIHDSLDQGTVQTRVKSCPWLNSNPLTTTPNCSMSCP